MPKRIMKKAPPKPPKRGRNFSNRLANLLIATGLIFVALSLGPLVTQELWFQLRELKNQKFVLKSPEDSDEKAIKDSPFARLISTKPIALDPKDRDFGLVIERLGVNVPVVKDVSVTNEDEYVRALKEGVAHALVSDYPSEDPGNVYLFAHASLNFWKLGKYATLFNLLRHLEVGDTVHIFYEGRDFVYKVINSEKYKGFNTYPITRPVLEPLLTLQTCDPPGTTLNRLVVTAKLVEIRNQDSP